MSNKTFLFQMPMPTDCYINGRHTVRNAGTLTISGTYSKDEEGLTPVLEEVDFCGVNILPVIEYSEGLKGSSLSDHIMDAVVDHLSEVAA